MLFVLCVQTWIWTQSSAGGLMSLAISDAMPGGNMAAWADDSFIARLCSSVPLERERAREQLRSTTSEQAGESTCKCAQGRLGLQLSQT